ncbi:MAG: hypothetical protein M1816_007618 [Peltula sp. TS41687]|nr:MAG: hypothetical protein M1816_007618 [Peltula sp. TS41687]
MDYATATLILKLQIEDLDHGIQEALDETGGKQSANGLSLPEIRRGLQETMTHVEDKNLALQMGREDHADQVLLASVLEDERTAANDHELASRLAGLTISRADRETTRNTIDTIASMLSAADEDAPVEHFDLDTGPIFPLIGVDGSSSSSGTASPSRAQGKERADNYVRCCVCQEQKPACETLESSCEPEHTYCCDCLAKHFESAMTDTELFPPRCCRQPIPLEAVRWFFSPDLLTRV